MIEERSATGSEKETRVRSHEATLESGKESLDFILNPMRPHWQILS